jgi:TRAP-type mannitol/chloroaromatic compound transport system substrate-binding protein
MKRRDVFKVAGIAALGAGLASPAIAQSSPEVKWRLTSSFPAVLDNLYGGAEIFARAVADLTDGRFKIEIHPAGEIASALEAFDSVSKGDIQCAQTALHYHWGVEPSLVFATAVPFGMNARQQNAFFRQGGGTDFFNEILVPHNLFALPAGNTGCQMGGWFRKELRSAADLKGLKFRISGLAGKVVQRLGCVPQAVARNDLANAFAAGTLDAAAWVAPVDDEKLNLTAVAPYYYYPGWFQGSMAVHIVMNLKAWNDLPKPYQASVRAAAEIANAEMQARYDAQNTAALKRLVASGAQLRGFPGDVLEACWQAATDTYREMADADEKFRRAQDLYMSFRNDQYLWWQVAEYPYDNFIIRQRAKG